MRVVLSYVCVCAGLMRSVLRDVFIKNPDGSIYIGQVWPGYTVRDPQGPRPHCILTTRAACFI